MRKQDPNTEALGGSGRFWQNAKEGDREALLIIEKAQ